MASLGGGGLGGVSEERGLFVRASQADMYVERVLPSIICLMRLSSAIVMHPSFHR